MEGSDSAHLAHPQPGEASARAGPFDEASAGKPSAQPSRSSPSSYTCQATVIVNSRRKKRHGFAVQRVQTPSEPQPQFVQPARVFRPKFPGTPPHTGRNVRQKQIQLQPSKSEISKTSSRRDKLKPYTLEAPPQAQKLPKSKFCDFYPWRGNHPEDNVTDQQAKGGYYDKLYVGNRNNEHNSARGPLLAALRQRSGLRTLSSLYLTILEKRQSYSAVTTPSTFKPPPRVTLPDQKREAWLRDLANPAVPLRRLSRTIPHGLKGPALLDQCMAKKIATARAVWFVRCVGANELRGLRRKGVGSLAVGGEGKWIKEWTSQVVQFMEKTIGSCGTIPDETWLGNMHYSLRLSIHLYAENLLDRIAFLEWYLSFLDNCSVDMLPLALVLATTFWDDLLRQRRLSKRFAEVFLGQCEKVIANNVDDLMIPLIRRLSIMVSNLLLCHREAIVGCNNWDKLKNSLQLADSRLPSTEQCLRHVTLRNEYLNSLMGAAERPSTVTGKRKAVDYLDAIPLPVVITNIYNELRELLPTPELVTCVFEWGVTSLRSGQYRAYLGGELLRLAARDGVGVQSLILDFLTRLDAQSKIRKSDVFLLVSELVRTDDFSIATYLRWLITKDRLIRMNFYDEGCPCYVQLLAEIPIHAAPPNHRNLRNILLNECSFDYNAQERAVVEAREMLSARGMFSMTDATNSDKYVGLTQDEQRHLRKLSRASKAELALWLKRSFDELVQPEPNGQNNWQNASLEPRLSNVPVTQIILVRQVLEELGDMNILVDIIKTVIASDDWEVLALAADAITYNLETFSILHSLDDFQQRLYFKYKKLQTQKSPSKDFIASFLDLLIAARCEGPMRQELQTDLALVDRRLPGVAVAQSPISESMDDDLFDDGELDYNAEIDSLWNSGATVDKQDMSRIFETTVSKMETSFEDANNQQLLVLAIKGLTKLRQLNPTVFDELSHRWVTRMQSFTNRQPLFWAFSSLIASSCLKLEIVADVALKTLEQREAGAVSATDGGMFVASVIDLFFNDTSISTLLSAKELYALKRKRKAYILTHPSDILTFFRQLLELCSLSTSEDLRHQTHNLISSPTSLDVLRTLAMQHLPLLKSTIIDPLVTPSNPTHLSLLQLFVDNLLDDRDSNDNTEVDIHIQVARLLDLATDFSIRLCKLKLSIITTSSLPATNSNTLARSFVRGFASASNDRRKICTDLISVLNEDAVIKIRTDVEELFLEWNVFHDTSHIIEQLDLQISATPQAAEGLARAFLAVVEATQGRGRGGTQQFMVGLLMERMAKLCNLLGNEEEAEEGGEEGFRCWFVLFMRLVVLHRQAFQGKAMPGEQGRMVVALAGLLKQPVVRDDDALFDLILGIAELFSDSLGEEVRAQVRRFAKGKKRMPLGTYLVGGGTEGGEQLRAMQKGKLVEFSVKPWERLAEPTPSIGENDCSISLGLFKTRRL